MTDKERIEVYVNRLPKSCNNCPLCRSGNLKLKRKGRYVEANECVLGNFYKIQTIDDEIDTCPLKTIQSMQNEKAVEALEKAKEQIKNKYLRKSGPARHYDIANTLDQLIKEYGGKDE